MENEPLSKKAIWTSIFRLIVPQKKTFLLVVLISILSTGVGLIEPLIYREAINDIAGLFVKDAAAAATSDYSISEEEDPISSFFSKRKLSETDSAVVDSITVGTDTVRIMSADGKVTAKLKPKKIPHKRNKVASRTKTQAFETLVWAVGILFVVSVIGHGFRYLGDNLNVKLSCGIEQGFIQKTFGHVLRLPLGFFGKRSSGALSKQINQQEEVSGIVNGFSQQILPEIISLTGILAIMVWQNLTLTLISLVVIPVYLYIAWKSAVKLESGLAAYYERWEEVSARIQDALSGIKTVKLSGAELREANRFKTAADGA